MTQNLHITELNNISDMLLVSQEANEGQDKIEMAIKSVIEEANTSMKQKTLWFSVLINKMYKTMTSKQIIENFNISRSSLSRYQRMVKKKLELLDNNYRNQIPGEINTLPNKKILSSFKNKNHYVFPEEWKKSSKCIQVINSIVLFYSKNQKNKNEKGEKFRNAMMDIINGKICIKKAVKIYGMNFSTLRSYIFKWIGKMQNFHQSQNEIKPNGKKVNEICETLMKIQRQDFMKHSKSASKNSDSIEFEGSFNENLHCTQIMSSMDLQKAVSDLSQFNNIAEKKECSSKPNENIENNAIENKQNLSNNKLIMPIIRNIFTAHEIHNRSVIRNFKELANKFIPYYVYHVPNLQAKYIHKIIVSLKLVLIDKKRLVEIDLTDIRECFSQLLFNMQILLQNIPMAFSVFMYGIKPETSKIATVQDYIDGKQIYYNHLLNKPPTSLSELINENLLEIIVYYTGLFVVNGMEIDEEFTTFLINQIVMENSLPRLYKPSEYLTLHKTILSHPKLIQYRNAYKNFYNNVL